MLTQAMSNLLPGFRVALESIRNLTLEQIVMQHPWLKITHHANTKEPHNAILLLKSRDMLQTSNLTEG